MVNRTHNPADPFSPEVERIMWSEDEDPADPLPTGETTKLDGWQLAEQPATWQNTRASFHRPGCRYATDGRSGTFTQAVLTLRHPALCCWKEIASPARCLRVSFAILRHATGDSDETSLHVRDLRPQF